MIIHCISIDRSLVKLNLKEFLRNNIFGQSSSVSLYRLQITYTRSGYLKNNDVDASILVENLDRTNCSIIYLATS